MVDDSALVLVRHQEIEKLLAESPGFARQMLAGLSQRLHRLVSDLQAYCLESSVQRVIGYLLSQVKPADGERDESDVVLPANKALIASRLSLTPETFSRSLHHLAEAGFIRVEGKTIHICELEALRAHRYDL